MLMLPFIAVVDAPFTAAADAVIHINSLCSVSQRLLMPQQ
jgi:hypothetical protein